LIAINEEPEVNETVIVELAGFTVTIALADFVESAVEIAVTVTVIEDVTNGAAYSPVAEIVPTCELPPPTPFTCHCTAVLVEPVTVAVNCCVTPEAIAAVLGETEIVTAGCPLALMVTVALADLLPSAAGIAVTVTVMSELVTGAWYVPLLEIVPTWALPPLMPFTCHCTEVLLEPVTVAWNCCVPPEATVAEFVDKAIATD